MHDRETMSRLNAALTNIDSAYAIIAKKHGLTFNALMMIYLMNEEERITQKQVCDALFLPKSTVHSILREFIKQGYATLEARDNKKEKHIVATVKGKQFISKICEETNRMERNVLQALGGDACAFLVETAEMLGILMKKELETTYGGEV